MMQISANYLQWSDLWFLLHGILNTLLVSVIACTLGTLLGAILGWARENSLIARAAAAPIVDIVRSVPLIIQFILAGSFLSIAGYPVDPVIFGTLVLSLYMSVLTSEVVRAGLAAVPVQVRKAARSLGMTALQELIWISIPLAVRTSIPGWIGLVLGLIKDTSLLGVVGYVELMRATRVLDARTHKTLLLLAGAGLFYFIICYPISRYSRRLERRLAT
jgi:His/Glu/Gln/Arg/opine family amino acid ABC transporter permease subunit